jgi:phenylacetic acid degradation protein
MPSYELNGIRPVVMSGAYVHPLAVLIGDVIVHENCFVAPNAVMRGDFGRLILGPGANLQDNCCMHGFPGTDTIVEENGHIGHGAILHGCVIKKNALVGMNSTIMDYAIIGENSFVAANSFVKAKFEVPANSLAAGSPAKVIRELRDEEINWKSKGTLEYQMLAQAYLEGLTEVLPDHEISADRARNQRSSFLTKPGFTTEPQK